jgi:hypothetical protein
MVSRKQYVLSVRTAVLLGLVAILITLVVDAQPSGGQPKKFYPDDPLWREPTPRPTGQVKARQVDDLYDFVDNRFVTPGQQEKVQKQGSIPAGDINTLGEVPDSTWYTNRHRQRRMSIAELRRGSGNTTPPDAGGAWQIVGAKSDGITPGLVIEDGQKRRFVLKFDPPKFPELASAADVISSKFFYALGYNTPENYIVHFRRENLTIAEGVKWRDANGKKHPLNQRVVDEMLKPQPKDSSGSYRALASGWIAGDLVGPFNYKGTRTDEPNDITPHENRRELRGLRVFGAWLNHTDVKQMNTMDALVTENGQSYIKHYLIDFGSTLGSDANFPKNAFRGHIYPLSPSMGAVKQIVTLGVYTPAWMRAHYPNLRGAGAFESATFDPESWIPDYPNAAFLMMDDEDAYWATKQVVAFTDEEIRAIVATGELTDERAADWITRCLIQRRDKIARTWLSRSLPLDRFRVENGSLVFDDLGAVQDLSSRSTYAVRWFTYDNDRDAVQPIPEAMSLKLPTIADSAGYVAAVLQCAASGKTCAESVTVFVRFAGSNYEVVGVDRQKQGAASGQIEERASTIGQ